MNFGNIQTASCVNVAPPPDVRCDDPAFALANPGICPVAPQLVIKPGVALTCAFGSIQFKAFIVKDGTETELTSGVIFATSNPDVAVVGAISGNATGLTTGETTVTATYQGMSAFANLTVLDSGCCNAEHVAMMLVVDNSRSMSQSFSANYSTKLTYARKAAVTFANSVNQTKDLVGLMRFNAVDDTVLAVPTSDKAAVAALVPGIAQTQQLTTFFDALSAAIGTLNMASADQKVIVLISDGVDTTVSYGADNNPIALLSDFKAQGGIVICLGVRAAGKGYNLLSAFSTGGFFINAYGADEANALNWLSGLKGYICAGNCVPEGDDFENRGVSNYTGFANWNVLDGEVDILGNGFFDVLPGNGLYVDLIGSPDLNGNFNQGTMQSKTTYSLLSGHQYRIALDLAGNQVANITDHVRITVKSASVTLLQQDVFISDYTQDFTTYAYTFTAPADMDVTIEIVQLDHDYNAPARLSGVLLNRVKFDDLTDLTSLLDDNFDAENKVYVPPRCGVGTYFTESGYISGYNCYGDGCLDTPPPAQAQDPSPQADIEAGFTPPVTYSSTKTSCATCGTNKMNVSTTNLIPVMTGPSAPSGTASASSDDGTQHAFGAFTRTAPHTGGYAADSVWDTLVSSYPVWLQYQFDAAQTVAVYAVSAAKDPTNGAALGFLSPPKAWTFQGSNDGATWDDLDTRVNIHWLSPGERKLFPVGSPAAYTYYRLLISEGSKTGQVGVISLEMFAAAPTQVCESASATSDVSQQTADDAARAAALALATGELTCVDIFSATEQFTAVCSFNLFPVTRSATAQSFNSVQEAQDAALAEAQALAEAARNCDQSTNGQQIVVTDFPATPVPYPSVKSVTGVAGTVTKVTVQINNLTSFFPKDIICVLQGPQGQAVVLFANAGTGAVTNLSMTFDDAGATIAPGAGVLVDGAVYKCGANGAYLPLPSPGPAQPHGTLLSVFNGLDPNGLWALWTLDDTAGNGNGTIDSWDLTITTV